MSFLANRWDIQPKHPWLRGQRPERPTRYDEETGMWNVYGYAEAIQVLSDPATYSSDITKYFVRSDVDVSALEGNLVRMDPPDHGQLRSIVGHAFTPKIISNLEPRIAEITHQLLDELEGKDSFDLVEDLAFPLPVIVITELLGVPSSDRPLFREWVDRMFSNESTVSLVSNEEELRQMVQEGLELNAEMQAYIHEHAAKRRTEPREDLLTKLVQADVEGRQLTDAQIANFATLLLAAGHITTTMLLGNTILCLDDEPDQLELVREDRGLLPGAIEESVRCLAPLSSVFRATTSEVRLGGERIEAGQVLAVSLSAANRDVAQFERPELFDVTRDPNPHLGFGRGVHFCLGAPLGRLEGRIALNILLDRLPEFRTDPENPPVFMPSPEMTGARSLPLRTRKGVMAR
ncbi:cytochrome P450 [Streptomyces sp. NPDC002911]